MATIQIKRFNETGVDFQDKVNTGSSLEYGEFAVNTTDKRLWIGNESNVAIEISNQVIYQPHDPDDAENYPEPTILFNGQLWYNTFAGPAGQKLYISVDENNEGERWEPVDGNTVGAPKYVYDLLDVWLSSPQTDDILVYDADSQGWRNEPKASAGGQVDSVVAGTNVTVDNTDPVNPIVNAEGQVDSVVAGTNVTVDNTDPVNPIINATGGGGGQVDSVVAGDNVTIDNTDPANPIISATGGGGGGAVDSVNGETGVVSLGIQDMDDYAAASVSLAAGSVVIYTFGNRDNGGQYEQPTNKSYVYLNHYDQNGALFSDKVGMTSNTETDFPIYWSTNSGAAWTLITVDIILDDGEWRLHRRDNPPLYSFGTMTGEIMWANAASEPVPVDDPPVDGDMLQWDDSEQAFRPVQLPVVEVVEVLNDLDDVSVAGFSESTRVRSGNLPTAPGEYRLGANFAQTHISHRGEWEKYQVGDELTFVYSTGLVKGPFTVTTAYVIDSGGDPWGVLYASDAPNGDDMNDGAQQGMTVFSNPERAVPETGEVLTYDGENWVAEPAAVGSSGAEKLTDLDDVDLLDEPGYKGNLTYGSGNQTTSEPGEYWYATNGDYFIYSDGPQRIAMERYQVGDVLTFTWASGATLTRTISVVSAKNGNAPNYFIRLSASGGWPLHGDVNDQPITITSDPERFSGTAAGEVLTYDGQAWVAQAPAPPALFSLTDMQEALSESTDFESFKARMACLK